MKSYEEIMSSRRVSVIERKDDGFSGIISMGNWIGSVVCSWGGGWDHVSVSPQKRSVVPSWGDMCRVKDIFFNDNEAVIQIHPPKDEYVNQMPNCLHLWRSNDKEMVLPPSFMVGLRKGQTYSQLEAEAKAYYKEHGYKL